MVLANPPSSPYFQPSANQADILALLSNELIQLIAQTRYCVVSIHGWSRPKQWGSETPFASSAPPPPNFIPRGYPPPPYPEHPPIPPSSLEPQPLGRWKEQHREKERPLSPSPSLVFSIAPSDMPVRLTGTGFFIQKDLVVTTAEVVGPMAHPIVITAGGKWVPVEGMNVDFKNNIAVLRLPADPEAKTFEWSQATEMPPGQLVLVFGNQAGFAQMATLGMITANNVRARSPDGQYHYADLLQFQGVIGPGASGAPVVNYKGEVIGMVVGALNGPPNMASSISPPNPPSPAPFGSMMGPTANVGFALPVSHLEPIVLKLAQNIRSLPPLGWFGLIPGRADRGGVQIRAVFEGGPADKAGLRPGDWIKAIDGKPLRERFEIPVLSEILPVGQKLSLQVERDGKTFFCTLIIQPRPNEKQLENMKPIGLPPTPEAPSNSKNNPHR